MLRTLTLGLAHYGWKPHPSAVPAGAFPSPLRTFGDAYLTAMPRGIGPANAPWLPTIHQDVRTLAAYALRPTWIRQRDAVSSLVRFVEAIQREMPIMRPPYTGASGGE